MDVNKNYYAILDISRNATDKEIKKSYYKLSFQFHPDKGGDELKFSEITEAYDVLTSTKRVEYDMKSRWGNYYDESVELLNFDFDNLAKGWDEDKVSSWKEKNQHNIVVYVEDEFDGNVEFVRWVICKDCGGDGRDTKSKIEIKDENGNILKMFDGSEGCDFCEGTGKDWNNKPCYFCGGKGEVGFSPCKTCKGEKRIMGKQKLKNLKWKVDEKSMKVSGMGHLTTDGRIGDLWILKK